MMHLVTGGAASGKSSHAEGVATRLGGPLLYIATMVPMGPEGAARVERHRLLRQGKGFATLERPRDIAHLELPQGAGDGTGLLECMGTLVGNELYDPADWGMVDPELVFQRVIQGVAHLKDGLAHLVVVTNEVGADGASLGPQTDAYTLLLGRVNCALAAMAECVTEVSANIPIILKQVRP